MANMVSRLYGGFRGVDFRGDETNLVRSPDSLNVWKDYRYPDSIRTRPKLKQFDRWHTSISVISMCPYEDGMLLFCRNAIYHMEKDGTATKVESDHLHMNWNYIKSFNCNGICYIMDGWGLYTYDEVHGISLAETYIPTTSIGRIPGVTGGGTTHEDINLLTQWRRNTFVGNGVDTVYKLDSETFSDADNSVEVEVFNDETGVFEMKHKVLGDYNVFPDEGKIEFRDPPPAPYTAGKDNVRITFFVKAEVDEYGHSPCERILNCYVLQMFDNRVFVGGNPNHPYRNMIFHSALNNPTYFSDQDYYEEGMDDSLVRGMVAGNDALWVFREPSDERSSIFYHKPALDNKYGKIYPSSHSNVATGCIGGAINFNDDICFFSERGMEGINGDVTTEQAVAHRSSLVDRKMISEEDYKNMILAEWEGYLFVFIGDKVYLADSRAAFTNGDHIEYEWFYWELDKKVTCAIVHDGTLFVGTESGVYTFSDYDSPVESYWTTPKDKFKYPNRLKTTNKRGCVVEAKGDVSVLVKTESSEYEPVGTYENVTDFFVSRIKRKKWKDIQLKFHSKTRFVLETATLECFLGGYIKGR